MPALRQFVALVFAAVTTVGVHAEISDETKLKLEVLRRLKGTDIEAKPALKQVVLATLEKVRGEPEFVELVRDFRLTDRQGDLLALARDKATEPVAVLALQTLLAQGAADQIKPSLAGASARLVIEALGNTGDNRSAALLLPLVTDAASDVATRRTAVRGLSKTQEGATALLTLAREDKLPSDVQAVAAGELAAVRWSAIKAEAAKVLPPPAAKGDAALPPVSELVKLSGDVARGAAIFRREDVACSSCHQVRGEGVDFGPKLTEIGDKLGKDALYEAILDPSAGVSFGFEAWTITLKNGDEAFGLIASETETDLAVKAQGGVVTRYPKADVDKREMQKQSIMPAGLQGNLTKQEFVDLVEYLSSLKKAK